ncbi:hypothetical protein [Nitrosopumilus sp.]|nr:hypothetical protein [Nitrosopumilus sp.]
MKKSLEQKLEPNNKEISFHNDMIDIWKNNAEKIKKELKKIDK